MEWRVTQETGDGLTISDGTRAIAYIEPAGAAKETQRIANNIAATRELLEACRYASEIILGGDKIEKVEPWAQDVCGRLSAATAKAEGVKV